MKVSVCITVLNAQGLIGPLLESLLNQTKKADEIVIVDGGSKDKTVEIIKHFQKKNREIKLLLEKCLRSEGRNLAVEISKNSLIVMTDAGCIPGKDWIAKITVPFEHPEIDIVAGLYKAAGETSMQKALGVFLGFPLSKFGADFLPTTRSIAFKREAWERVGGFPEREANSAEDTEFNYKAVKLGLRYSRVKDAIVEWGIPRSLKEGLQTMGGYARWDARYGIWWHPTQRFESHNIRVVSVFLRYLIGTSLVILGFSNSLLLWLAGFGLILYISWAFRKVYQEFPDWKIGIWGPLIQVASDFAVMAGFLKGLGRTQETRLPQ